PHSGHDMVQTEPRTRQHAHGVRPHRGAGRRPGDHGGADPDQAGVRAPVGEIVFSREALAHRRRGRPGACSGTAETGFRPRSCAKKCGRREGLMETRANYVLIGLFTLAVIAGAFGFVYWVNTIGGAGGRQTSRIVSDGSVSGLRTGASVLFNGIRVGEVTELRLDPARPRAVVATVSLEKSVAVRADTAVSLEYQGVTGTASIALRRGSDASSRPPRHTLNPHPSGAADVTRAARAAV